jgi:hypothetical protein
MDSYPLGRAIASRRRYLEVVALEHWSQDALRVSTDLTSCSRVNASASTLPVDSWGDTPHTPPIRNFIQALPVWCRYPLFAVLHATIVLNLSRCINAI